MAAFVWCENKELITFQKNWTCKSYMEGQQSQDSTWSLILQVR